MLFNISNFCSSIESTLPTFATDHFDTISTSTIWVKSDYINVTVIGVLIRDKVWMIAPREKFHIVPNEVTIMQQILFDELFEDVFFGCHVGRAQS